MDVGSVQYARTELATLEPCHECVELWFEYAEARGHHVAAIKKRERAARSDAATFAEAEDREEAAAARRESALDALKGHVAAAHGAEPGANRAAMEPPHVRGLNMRVGRG
jgi:hypothetical protein